MFVMLSTIIIFQKKEEKFLNEKLTKFHCLNIRDIYARYDKTFKNVTRRVFKCNIKIKLIKRRFSNDLVTLPLYNIKQQKNYCTQLFYFRKVK